MNRVLRSLKLLIFSFAVMIGWVAAAVQPNVIDLTNTTIVDLSIEESSVGISIDYPGKEISGICSVEIVADSYGRDIPVENLLERIVLESGPNHGTPAYKVVSPMVIRIDLGLGGFQDSFLLKTKNGETLASAIKNSLGSNRTVVLMPRTCD